MIEQTKIKPQETLEFVMNEQTQTSSFNPPLNFSEGGKLLLSVTSFEEVNSLFSITDKNNSFLITIEGHSSSRGGAETINKIQRLLQLR